MRLNRSPFEIAGLSGLLIFILAPFLVPFDPNKNTDLAAYLIIVAGSFCWIALSSRARKANTLRGADAASLWLLLGSAAISSIFNPHLWYSLLGAPNVRLGLLSFVAILGISSFLTKFRIAIKLQFIYWWIFAFAIISVPYTMFKHGSLERIGGLFSQADIFACLLGVGLLTGLILFKNQYITLKLFAFSQTILGVLLLLTQTRAAIFLTLLLTIIWLRREQAVSKKHLIAGVLLVGLVFANMHIFWSDRTTNRVYALESLNYRLALQREGLEASTAKPLLGYGPGNLADALDCKNISSKELEHTCEDNYFFNSSHNIFLDRIIAFGWLGGLSFLGLVILAMKRAWSGKKELRGVAYLIALIAGYYLTNVTHIVLETLLWILLLTALLTKPSRV